MPRGLRDIAADVGLQLPLARVLPDRDGADRARNCSMSNRPTSSLSQSTSSSLMSGACRVMWRLTLGSTRSALVTVAVNAAAASVNRLSIDGAVMYAPTSAVWSKNSTAMATRAPNHLTRIGVQPSVGP